MLVLEGQAFCRGKLQKACVGVEEGRIIAVAKDLKGDRHIDLGHRLILPAGIDIHAHFRDPGFPLKEDFASGTLAAAFGGISCAVDMPNTKPATVSVSDLKRKIRIAESKAYVDFGLNCALTHETDVQATAPLCSGYKMYLSSTTSAGDITISNPEDIAQKTAEASKAGRNISAHCEDESQFGKKPGSTLEQWNAGRPAKSEAQATMTLLSGAADGMNIHICHVSAKETIDAIVDARKGRKVTCEVTPHHLFLSEKSELGAFGKVNPPLRSTQDQAAMWEAFTSGNIDVIASDHAPHTADEKKAKFVDAPSGMPGVETMYPLLLWQAKKGRVSLERLMDAVAGKPAAIYGMKKGKLEEGFDADIAVFDARKPVKLRSDRMHSRCGWTPYEGMEALMPEMVLVRGEIVIQDCELAGKKGFGRIAEPGS